MILGSLATAALAGDGPLLVIAHLPERGEMTARQVAAVFLGRTRTLSGGVAAQPLDRQPGDVRRRRFYRLLTGKSEADVDAYWARQRFSGQGVPPDQVGSDAEAIERVRLQVGAIAYIAAQDEAALRQQGVEVVLRLGGE